MERIALSLLAGALLVLAFGLARNDTFQPADPDPGMRGGTAAGGARVSTRLQADEPRHPTRTGRTVARRPARTPAPVGLRVSWGEHDGPARPRDPGRPRVDLEVRVLDERTHFPLPCRVRVEAPGTAPSEGVIDGPATLVLVANMPANLYFRADGYEPASRRQILLRPEAEPEPLVILLRPIE